jgi:hypothetical protein
MLGKRTHLQLTIFSGSCQGQEVAGRDVHSRSKYEERAP